MTSLLRHWLRTLAVLPDYLYVSKQFRSKFGFRPNLREPKIYAEKMQWLKLYWHDGLLTTCADKYAVRAHVAKVLGPEVLNELYGVYEDPSEIDFDSLPDQFVLKTTHGCSQNLFCLDRAAFDREAACRQLKKWLKTRHFEFAREWAYKDIRPRILCEKYLGEKEKFPYDYKFYCFGGEPRYIHVDIDRYSGRRQYFFDPEWQPLDLADAESSGDDRIERPAQLSRLLECASALAAGFPFVRNDFYLAGGKIIFGEMTFYPAAGYVDLTPPEYNRIWGDLLQLPQV